MRHLLAAALALSAILNPPAAMAKPDTSPGATLTITFHGVETRTGSVMIALYDAAGWTGGKPIRVAMADAAAAAPSVSIADLPPGRYGIKAFHDVDGDGKMGTNPFGMPTEPFAFSNDAKGNRGPASWDAASFEVVAPGGSQGITIR
ncbi:MAG: DUF2141 domain-containing protein [Sphingomonas bacterium]